MSVLRTSFAFVKSSRTENITCAAFRFAAFILFAYTFQSHLLRKFSIIYTDNIEFLLVAQHLFIHSLITRAYFTWRKTKYRCLDTEKLYKL